MRNETFYILAYTDETLNMSLNNSAKRRVTYNYMSVVENNERE